MCDLHRHKSCWGKRVSAYQSPEPTLFTVNVPALDGGERHRVGVLQTDGDKEKEIFKPKGQRCLQLIQYNTAHP